MIPSRTNPQAKLVHEAVEARSRLVLPRRDGFARSAPFSAPASRLSPNDSALRANPYPEVTDRICRLPLPTLFYRLEAVNLGDLMRIWVRTGTKLTQSPSDFQGPSRARRTPQEPRCFTGNPLVPIAERIDSRERDPYKEKKTLPGALADVSDFVCVAAPDPSRGRSPWPGSGMLTGFPFGR